MIIMHIYFLITLLLIHLSCDTLLIWIIYIKALNIF